MTARFRPGATLDLLAQATVIAGFSRVGLTVRSGGLLWERCAWAAVITPPVPDGFESDTGGRGA